VTNVKCCVSFILLFILLGASENSVVQQSASFREQLVFSAEDSSVKKPVAIPNGVLAMLRRDETVRSVLENENLPPESLPSTWFAGSLLHLADKSNNDLIVVAGPPVSGGNVALFWVFRSVGHEYQLVLSAPAHSLRVLNTRSKGYRDIELVSLSALEYSRTVCRFGGEKYTKYKTESRPIR
jgi:hypothetical protein